MTTNSDYDGMTVEQLDVILAGLEADRLQVRERALQVARARSRKLAEDHAAEHGFTAEGYAAAKAEAASQGVPFDSAFMKKARKRSLQVATAQPVDLSTTAKATGAG